MCGDIFTLPTYFQISILKFKWLLLSLCFYKSCCYCVFIVLLLPSSKTFNSEGWSASAWLFLRKLLLIWIFPFLCIYSSLHTKLFSGWIAHCTEYTLLDALVELLHKPVLFLHTCVLLCMLVYVPVYLSTIYLHVSVPVNPFLCLNGTFFAHASVDNYNILLGLLLHL